MPRLTMLSMVQDILSDMDSDEVNSIEDTTEALQVAQIIQTTYYDMMAKGDWPHLKTLFKLEATSSSTPSHMKMPENMQYLISFDYDVKKSGETRSNYQLIKYKTPEDFLSFINGRDSSSSTVDSVTDFSDVTLLIRNDVAPSYWTSFDDEYIVCDAYDSDVESNLQASKTQCFGFKEASLTITDGSIPDLPSKAFPYLLAEAKSTCFNAIKQAANPKEEAKAQSQKRNLSQDRWRHNGGIKSPNFGWK